MANRKKDMSTNTTENENKAKREAYSAAIARVRDAHIDDFNKFRVEEMAKRGFDWKPPLNAEQKAAAEVERLLRENPALAEKYKVVSEDD